MQRYKAIGSRGERHWLVGFIFVTQRHAAEDNVLSEKTFLYVQQPLSQFYHIHFVQRRA